MTPSKSGSICLWIAIAAPFGLLVAYVLHFGVDIPYNDQWLFLPLLHGILEGEWLPRDLWVAHNNTHRLLFPRLVMIGLARLTDWNTGAEMLATCLCLLAIFLGIVRMHVRAAGQFDDDRSRWPLVGVALLVCSFQQWENLLWGWQLQILMSVAALVWALALLPPRPRPRGLIAPAALGIIASYSFLNGLAVWPLGFLQIALARCETRPIRAQSLILWSTIAAVTMGLFVWGLQFGGPDPFLDEQPVTAKNMAIYFCRFFGVPLVGGVAIAWLPGLLIVICFLLLLGWCWRRRNDRPGLVPIAVLGLYSLGSGALTTAGRTSHGIGQSLASRYVTISSPMWISVLLMSFFASRDADRRRGDKRLSRAWTVLVVGLLALYLVRQEKGYLDGREHSRFLSRAREAYISGRGLTKSLLERLHPKLAAAGTGRAVLLEHRLSLFRDPAARKRALPALYRKLRLAVERTGSGQIKLRVSNGISHRLVGVYAVLPGPAFVPVYVGTLDEDGGLALPLPLPAGAGPASFLALSLNRFDALILSDRVDVSF